MEKKTVDILMYGNEKVVDLDEPFTVYNADLIPDEEVKEIYTASMEDIQRGIDIFEVDGRLTAAVKLVNVVFDQFVLEMPELQNYFYPFSKKHEILTNKKHNKYWIKINKESY